MPAARAYNAFDEVAEEWRQYRPNASSELAIFLPLTPKGSIVLDAGCAHGRNHEKILSKASFLYAFDLSPRLVEFARQNAEEKNYLKKTKMFVGDITKIGLDDSSVDCVFCNAVLHHLKTAAERRKALSEFARVLKKSGLLFLSVWNVHQKRFEKLGKKRNALVPWRTKKGKVVQRFYHFFEESELSKLSKEAGLEVEKTFFEKKGREHACEGAANLCGVFVKK